MDKLLRHPIIISLVLVNVACFHSRPKSEVPEYRHVFTGSHEGSTTTGYFSSRHFPDAYRLHTDAKYIYTIKNLERDGYVQLVFTDVHLHPYSQITIYDDENWLASRVIHRIAGGSTNRHRVALGSRGQFIGVVFEIGCCEKTNTLYQGFRAEYRLVPYPPDGWLERPITDCGDLELRGGSMTLQNLVQDSKYYDCVWVYEPDTNTRAFTKVEILQHNRKHDAFSEITIHNGLTSTATLLQTIRDEDDLDKQPATGFQSDTGLYIRFRGKFHYGCKVSITYGSYIESQSGCSIGGTEYSYYCRGTGRCIRQDLACDGANHCGNGEDELVSNGKCIANDLQPLTWPSLTPASVCPDGTKPCVDGICVTDHTRCAVDDTTDSGSLVQYLEITMIGISCAVLAVLIIIIIIIICCIRRYSKCCTKHQRGRHRQSEQDRNDVTVAAEFLQVPDSSPSVTSPTTTADVTISLSPPSYNDVIAENIQLATQLIKPEDKRESRRASPPPPYTADTSGTVVHQSDDTRPPESAEHEDVDNDDTTLPAVHNQQTTSTDIVHTVSNDSVNSNQHSLHENLPNIPDVSSNEPEVQDL